MKRTWVTHDVQDLVVDFIRIWTKKTEIRGNRTSALVRRFKRMNKRKHSGLIFTDTKKRQSP